MITVLSWLAVGILLSFGRVAVSALPYAGGACVVLILLLLGAIALHAAAWAIRRERQIEQIASGALPDDTAPLTAYEERVISVLTAIDAGELHEGLYGPGSEQ